MNEEELAQQAPSSDESVIQKQEAERQIDDWLSRLGSGPNRDSSSS